MNLLQWTVLWGAVLITILIGVDVVKNPQSYRNIGLRFGDGCRHLWFWPGRLSDAHRYTGRHRKHDAVSAFDRHWKWS